MKSESVLLKNIEILGDKYVQEHVRTLDKGRLERDWWEALKFIFSRSFMRGRRDELSARYFDFTMGVLKDLIGIDEADSEDAYSKLVAQRGLFKVAKEMKKKSLKDYPEFAEIVEGNPVVRALSERKNEKKDALALGNIGDIVMVLEVLAFITESEQKKNIYRYLLRRIEGGDGVESAFRELIGMKYIGNKIASFIIRDILLLNPDIKLKDNEYEYAFPVDTWVNQIAEKMGCKRKTLEETKRCLIEKGKANGLNVFKFAAGLWYLGFNSLEVLLNDYLEYHEIAR
jgi:hypothetical protein